MSIKDGGPAFPYVVTFKEGTDVRYEEGLSLRDYFAGKAMQALIEKYDESAVEISVAAYEFADQMLKARDKK